MNLAVRRAGGLSRLWRPLLALLAVVGVGTAGYVVIEGWPIFDALYMAVTTVGTIGYGEIHPLSVAGRVFTIGLIAVGLASLWYALSVMVGLIVEGHLTQQWERRRMERRLGKMAGHYIVCGFGRVGRQIADELVRDGRQVVVVDTDPEALASAVAVGDGLATVEGNATEDETLLAAGIARAGGLIAAVASDADNIFVTLSARALHPSLAIVTRANHDDAIPKLRRAGATQVVSPYAMAGRQMARLALRPATVDFVETLMRGTNAELLLEDVRIAGGSPLAGLSVADARRRLSDVLLLALRREGEMTAPLPADLTLRADDVLAAVGREDALRRLEDASRGREAPVPATADAAVAR